MLAETRTGIVFRKITNNGIVKIDNVTSVQVFNGPTVPVTINGLKLEVNQNKTIVIADGTVSNFEIDIQFETLSSNSLTTKQLLDVIYKKVIQCTP